MTPRLKVFRAHRALAFFYALIGVASVAVMSLASRGQFALEFLPMAMLFGLIFAVHWFTAQACKQGKQGGRVASIVIACLMLLGFPLGTLIGIYLLVNTSKPWTEQVPA